VRNEDNTQPNFPVASISFYSGKRNPELSTPPKPLWWEAMFCLLIIADEACDRLGHFVVEEEGKLKLPADRPQPQEKIRSDGQSDGEFRSKLPDAQLQSARLVEKNDRWETKGDIQRAKRSRSSLTMLANSAILAVQPKGRVTSVGCSIRNLSRNLAAVGPTGPVRCNWQQLPSPCATKDFDSLNLLLIPIPYSLHATDFEPKKETGRFGVTQRWLDDPETGNFIPQLVALVERATREGEIHGIILPELAINNAIFEKLQPALFNASGKTLKFLISGSSSDCNDHPGNMVFTAIWEQNSTTPAGPTAETVRYFSQRKHQRWRIDEDQIKNYALGSVLSTSNGWWEDHEIGQRELHFFQLRSNTVFASLICEDMARNDPCHDIVRSVAPNLVFALLMDGPQLPTRWPARYAGALADDPGCTVLSFTSYALVGRSNGQSQDRTSNSVGLLRDSTGATHEIVLPRNKDAILISLSSSEAKDKTMDGRETRYASRWKFLNQMPIRIGLRDKKWARTADTVSTEAGTSKA
jgi:hypothetical protein